MGATGTKHGRVMGTAGDGHGGHGDARGRVEVPITPLITNIIKPQVLAEVKAATETLCAARSKTTRAHGRAVAQR